MPDRLGSAQWESQKVVSQSYPFSQGKFWLGRSEHERPIGYRDDRHVCLVSGNRGGKGTSLIVNNLCLWPGSVVVVDPKGENATVTASRRGRGTETCTGMGQAVHVLDPFHAFQGDESYRSCLNPLDALDPNNDETIDEAARLANAIVVVKDESADPFWDESARAMLRGLILHVLTAPEFTDNERNLLTIRNLISRGEWRIAQAITESGREAIGSPHKILWKAMECNEAFDGIVAGIGSRFLSMMTESPKTFESVLQATALHTEFLDSPGMRRVLVRSNFKLSELKTRPEGMTLYLSLPQRYMDTHYRWLRMMVALTMAQMEITRGNPATGHPVLMVLDEFAGLKRMTSIENAVAQIAGFGVKLLFVLQSLEQLKYVYKDNWETFLANAGVKVFFGIEDHFTRDYVSKLAGETEIIRELQSSNQSQSANESYAAGQSHSDSLSESVTHGSSQSITRGTSQSLTHGTSQSTNLSQTEGVNHSRSSTESFGTNRSRGWSSGSSSSSSFGPNGSSFSFGSSGSSSGSWGASHSTSEGVSEGTSSSVSRGVTDGTSVGDTYGRSRSSTTGTTFSKTAGQSETWGTSETRTQGSSRTLGAGRSESVHRRPLIQPDEVGRFFARIDDKNQDLYPGLALVLVTGADPFAVRRTHYFDDPQFIDCFAPHPDHNFLAPVTHTINTLEVHKTILSPLEAERGGRPVTVARWLIKAGDVVFTNQVVARVEGIPPRNYTVHLRSPYYGKVTETAETAENALPAGEYRIPIDHTIFTIKSFQRAPRHSDVYVVFRELGSILAEIRTARALAQQRRDEEQALAQRRWEQERALAQQRRDEENRQKAAQNEKLTVAIFLVLALLALAYFLTQR